jgi:transcriptional regulator with XRE-family HTH domain
MIGSDPFASISTGPAQKLEWVTGGRSLVPEQHERDVIPLVRAIGKRMTDARKMCGLSQLEAARRIGYANSSKLAKVEKTTDISNVPIWLLVRAAKVYDVSLDFLTGISESETANTAHWRQQRKISEWLFDHWQVARERDLAALAVLNDRIEYVWRCTITMQAAANEAALALVAFMEANPEFEEMRGGARLVRTVSAVDDAALSNKKLVDGLQLSLEKNKAQRPPFSA